MDQDFFTLDGTRAALARVREPLAALQRVQALPRAVRTELALLGRQQLNDGVVAERRVRALRQEQRRPGEEGQRHASAIRDAGVELKHMEDGLIDFPTAVGGVPAYWCWRTGEDDIEWWHPRATGFAGRRRIASG